MALRPIFTARGTAALVLVAVVGCSTPPPAAPPPPLAGPLRISGSNTVFPYARDIARGFAAAHTRVTFLVTADGTARGIKFAGEGQVSGLPSPLMSTAEAIPPRDAGTIFTNNGEHVNLGMASRDLLPDEREAYPEARVVTFAIDGIAVATNAGINVPDLTVAQLRDIYAGRTTDWSAFGLPAAPIYVLERTPISGTAGAWAALVMNGEHVIAVPPAQVVNMNSDMATAIAANPNSIGYLSFGFLNATIHPVSVAGVAPTVPNLLRPTTDGGAMPGYPIRRPLVFVTRGAPTRLEQAFIDFALSPAGQMVVQANGAVPAAGATP